MNYEEMSDFEINELVLAIVSESDVLGGDPYYGDKNLSWNYCNNPSDAWPIIVKNKIRISPVMYMSDDNGEYICNGMWDAGTLWSDDGAFYNSKYNEASNENPLRAAMIVFLMMQEQAK